MNSKNGHRAKRGNCNALPAAEESEKTWETKKFRNRAPPLERRAPCAAFCSAGATRRWRRHSRSGTFNSPSSARAKKGSPRIAKIAKLPAKNSSAQSG